MDERTSFDIIRDHICGGVRAVMQLVQEGAKTNLCEIRLRAGRPVCFVYPDRTPFLTRDGRLTGHCDGNVLRTSGGQISQTISILAHYSLHSCAEELSQGWFVLSGGIRVGVAGTFSGTEGGAMRDWNGLNFRISREVRGCGEVLRGHMQECRRGLLICGGVGSGKTTILRDLCRSCGNMVRVSLIDERNEIAALENGTPGLDVGMQTDIFAGCARAKGIETAVRTMSPDIIFCDEISSDRDTEAVLSAVGCGVRLCATMHARNYSDLISRRAAQRLISGNAFDIAAFLNGSSSPGCVQDIRRLENA